MTGMRRRSSLLLATVLALLGFLLVTAAFTTQKDKRAGEARKEELVRHNPDRRTAGDDPDQAVRQLRDQVAAAERADARRNVVARDTAERNSSLAAQAGTTAMRGP